MRLYRENINTGLACAIIAGFFVRPTLAYHPLSGIAPQTNWQRFLSGVRHLIVCLDHLASPIVFGVMIAFLKNRMMAGALFITTTTAGTLMLLAGGFLPMTELVISASIVLSGFLVTQCRDLKLPTAVALSIGSGLFHGFAFGAALNGSEPSPIVDYFLGLVVVQMGVVFVTAFVFFALWKATKTIAPKPRLSGAFAAVGGLVCLLEHVEGMTG